MLSRVLGLVREQVIAAQFGTGPEVAAYNLAFTIPDQLFILLSGGALSSAFIPMFARLRREGRDDEAWGMASGVLSSMVAGAAVLIGLAWLLAPLLVRDVIASRSDDPVIREQAIGLMRVLLLQPLLLCIAAVGTAILQSHDRFAIPALGPAVYNTCSVLGAVTLTATFGIYGVAFGVVAGASLFVLMQWPTLLRLGLRLRPETPFANPQVRAMYRLMLPRIVGAAAVQANFAVALYLAAGLDESSVGAFRYAYTVYLLPVGLFGTSVASVAFPALAREAADADQRGFLYLLRRAIRGVLFLVIPAGVGLATLREPIVTLLFERGAFTRDDTLLVSAALFVFCFGMWAYTLVDLLPRAFYALQDTRTPVKIALASVALNALLSWNLVDTLGLAGIAISFAVATSVQTVLLVAFLSQRVGWVVDRGVATFLVKAIAAAGLMFVALLPAAPLLKGYAALGAVELAIRVGLVIAGAASVYVGASIALGQEEVRTLMRAVRRSGPDPRASSGAPRSNGRG